MKVLFWCEPFWPEVGGIPVIASNLVHSLGACGHEVHVVAGRPPRNAEPWGAVIDCPVTRFGFLETLTARDPAMTLSLVREVAVCKAAVVADVIIIFALTPGVMFHLQTRSASNAPVLLALHGQLPWLGGGEDTLVTRALHDATRVTACSRSCLEEARTVHPFLTSKSSVVHNAIPPLLSDQAQIGIDPARVLFVGRLSEEKGVDVLLRAVPAITKRVANLRLELAGDGPLRDSLESLAQELSLGPHVQFVGTVSPEHIPARMLGASVVVVPSRNEGFGLVALEAAQMGRAVVASRVGGLPEVVVDGQTGILVAPDDPAILANALLRLLDDPTLAKKMGDRARVRAEKHFCWQNYVNNYDEQIRALKENMA